MNIPNWIALVAAALAAFGFICSGDNDTPKACVMQDAAGDRAGTAPALATPGRDRPPAAAGGKAAQAPQGKPAQAAWAKNIAAWKAEGSHEPADNSFCYVCHLNYDDEELATAHRTAGVGCETCHGVSDKHSEDEDNITPPDVMFPKASIVSFCLECHVKEELIKQESHENLFDKGAPPKKTCTDCHGEEHRLKVRTRKWDKRTRELQWFDGVRMMQEGREAKN